MKASVIAAILFGSCPSIVSGARSFGPDELDTEDVDDDLRTVVTPVTSSRSESPASPDSAPFSSDSVPTSPESSSDDDEVMKFAAPPVPRAPWLASSPVTANPLSALNMTTWRAQAYSVGHEQKWHVAAQSRFAFVPRIRLTPSRSEDSVAFGAIFFDGHVRVVSLPLTRMPADCPNSEGTLMGSINYGVFGLGVGTSYTALKAFELHKEMVSVSPTAAFRTVTGIASKHSIFEKGLKSILSAAQRAQADALKRSVQITTPATQSRKRPRAVSLASSNGSSALRRKSTPASWPEAPDDWVRDFLEEEAIQAFFATESTVGVPRSVASSLAQANVEDRCGGGLSMYTFRRMGPLMMWTATFGEELNISVLLAPEGS